MSLKTLIEGFDRKYSAEQPKVVEKYSLEEASKAMTDLAKALFSTLRRLENNYESNIKAYEVAFQDAIEGQFPGKSWWEVTNCNIFDSLFRGRDPELTVTEILKGVKPEYKEEVTEDIVESISKYKVGQQVSYDGMPAEVIKIEYGTFTNLAKIKFLKTGEYKWVTEGSLKALESVGESIKRKELTEAPDEFGLPTEVVIDVNSLVDDDIDLSGDEYNLDDVIADWLSDEYGFLHYGFDYDYDYDKDPDYVYVSNIKWDTSESYKPAKRIREARTRFSKENDDMGDAEYKIGLARHIREIPKYSDEQLLKDYRDFKGSTHKDDRDVENAIKHEMKKRGLTDETQDKYDESLTEDLSYGEIVAIEQEWNKFKKKTGRSDADAAWEFIETECKGVYDSEEEKDDVFALIGTLEETDESFKVSKTDNLKEARGNYGHKGPFWYFTLHGVQPGTIPSDVKVLEIRDGVNRKGTQGTFVALDSVLTGDELKFYDLIELAPENPSLKESKKINERKWSYTLRNGANLRDAIDAEDYYGVIESLKKCYQELLDAEIIDEDDYETYVEDFEYIDVDDEDAEEEIDFQLGEFYDLCDNLGVWVSMNESVEDSEKTDKHVIKIKDINKNVEWEKEDDSEVGDPTHPIQIGLRGRVNKLESVESDSKEANAEKQVRLYYAHKFDLPELHRRLKIIFGNTKDAVEWFADNDERIKYSKKNESVGDQVSEYQKWVDYDMKKYHRISDVTMRKIKEAGLSVVKDQYDNYEVIADRPIKEAYEQKYVFEFEDGAEIPATSEDEAVRIYKRLMKGRQAHAARKFSELDDIANDLYEKRDVEGFCDFTNKELAILWAHCLVTQHNPYGQPYDDEVYDTISMLPNREAIFKNAKLMVNAGLSEDVNEVEYQKKYYAQRKPDGTGEVEYFEVEEPVHVRDWHLGGRNRKSITKDEYNQKAFGIRESAEDDKLVVYKCLGKYCVTPKWNYKSRIQDARKIKHLDDFESAEEIKQYYNKYFHTTDDDFEVIDEAVDPKAFYQMIIDTNGNPSIEDFKSVGYSEPMATELLSRMASSHSPDSGALVKAAKSLLGRKDESNQCGKSSINLKEYVQYYPAFKDSYASTRTYDDVEDAIIDAKANGYDIIVRETGRSITDLNPDFDRFSVDGAERYFKKHVDVKHFGKDEESLLAFLKDHSDYDSGNCETGLFAFKVTEPSVDESLKEAMLFKPMTRDEAKDFYNRIKSSEMDAKFKKIVLDDLNFFTDNFEKDYGKREVKESVKKPQHKISEDVGDEMQVYMNTWANYNEYGADLSQYGIKDGWMSIDDALDFCEEHAEDEPFINDTDNIPSAFEINEYSNAVQTLEELKQFEESGADIDIVEAIMMSGYSSIKDALDKYEDGDYYWYPGVTNSTDLAYAVIDEIGSLSDAVGDRVNDYIDEDAMRRDYEWDVREMMRDDAKSEVAREEGIDEDEVTDEQVEDWIDDNIDSYLDSVIDEEIALAEQGEIDLSNYFDYERFGRDLSFDGYVFTDAGAILVP